ncbi:ribonuclease G [Bifidobacterium italicum]|uniref:Ribonuclease E n=2 Tax=Bifidobacterium italicum TaxID=1960968 RepID=A0A2A2EJP1_9BIFI|nr:Rne/Rng family ribonuclease [Bifidobacterium italicum]PAU69116.1 ribonuclease G [Bifidobacterium italicum]
MPDLTDDFVANETSASAEKTTEHTVAQPAPRRRGRRVVRDAGAANASVELKVEEHAPLFREPSVPALPASKPAPSITSSQDDKDSADGEPKQRRRRTRATSTSSRGRSSTAAVDALDDFIDDTADHESARASHRRASRPMTSLLFQEPVIPQPGDDESDRPSRRYAADDDEDEPAPRRRSRRASAAEDDEPSSRRRPRRASSADEDDDDEPSTSSRRSRRAKSQDDGEESPSPRSRRRSRRTTDTRDDDAAETTEATEAGEETSVRDYPDGDEEMTSSRRRSRRSNRRLNAQERRAAAEVEQIEEDLVLDDITYAPIDDAIARNAKKKADDEDDEDEETPMRTRRRRRSRRSQDADAETTKSNDKNDDGESGSHDEDDEEATVTRRRRRRRGGKNAEEETTTHRSRKQQYIDEITDVEGSTRLEAKKQRRRDNRRERSRQNQLLEQDFLARRENVDRLMVVRQRDRHTQISVLEDNVLVEHYVSDIQEVATVGNIYLGRVQNVLPSMEAAFVDIGQARNGVLYAGEVNWDTTRLEGQPRRIELAFRSGDPVLVQVTKDPIGHKGARLTSQVTLAGRFLVLVPSGGMTGVSRKLSSRERSRLKSIVSKVAPKDMGVIIRTAAEGASEEAIVKDMEQLAHQWEQIQKKFEEFRHGKRPKLLQGEPDMAIRVVRDIFNDDFRKMIVEGDGVYERIEQYLDTMAPDLSSKLEKWDPAEHEGKDVFDKWQIDSQLRKGMERQVYLPSGGSIVIDRTEAMTTIDVNTGRFIGRGKSLEETVTRCNLEASEEIARQLRLRDIGGMVMIDYVDMVMPANRDLVLRRLVECLARDRTKHQVAEVTSLGLVQMTRKRIGQGLVEAFSEECPTCKGRGFIVHDEPTISSDYDDPYALKGGDPFVKTNKHGHGSEAHGGSGSHGAHGAHGAGRGTSSARGASVPQGSSDAVKQKLAQIAAAAVAATNAEEEIHDALNDAETLEVQIEHIEENED